MESFRIPADRRIPSLAQIHNNSPAVFFNQKCCHIFHEFLLTNGEFFQSRRQLTVFLHYPLSNMPSRQISVLNYNFFRYIKGGNAESLCGRMHFRKV